MLLPTMLVGERTFVHVDVDHPNCAPWWLISLIARRSFEVVIAHRSIAEPPNARHQTRAGNGCATGEAITRGEGTQDIYLRGRVVGRSRVGVARTVHDPFLYNLLASKFESSMYPLEIRTQL